MSRRTSPIDDGLARLGLEIGQIVRYQGTVDKRAHDGVVLRLERDGSVGLRDDRGRARAIAVEAIEVRVIGPRGGEQWIPLTEAGGGLQLGLF
ncbi:MAG TPA: hypothetical protein VHK88_03545 [Aquihabitans sp.]|nr:hypothetical protein [Aquihabitans sp.]